MRKFFNTIENLIDKVLPLAKTVGQLAQVCVSAGFIAGAVVGVIGGADGQTVAQTVYGTAILAFVGTMAALLLATLFPARFAIRN